MLEDKNIKKSKCQSFWRLIGVLMMTALPCPTMGQSPEEIMMAGFSIKKMILPVISKNTSKVVASVSIGRIYLDYETRGFFKIGILPVIVIEQAALHINSPEETTTTWKEVHEALKSLRGRRKIIINGLNLFIHGKRTWHLSVSHARMITPECWELTHLTLEIDRRVKETHHNGFIQFSKEGGGCISIPSMGAMDLTSMAECTN